MKTGNKKGGGLGAKVHKEVGNRFGAKASNLNPRAVRDGIHRSELRDRRADNSSRAG